MGVFLAALMLSGLAACSNSSPSPSATNSTDQPMTLEEKLQQVANRVEGLRELEFRDEVDRSFMTQAELREFILTQLEEESREDIASVQKVLAFLGLIPADTDLFQLYVDLLTEQVLGAFDPATDKLYLIAESDELGTLEEVTLAHEYTHALQQQHLDLEALLDESEDNLDAATAVNTLVEGDAMWVQQQYMLAHLSISELQELLVPLEGSPIFDAAPYVIQEDLLFPYVQGLEFVTALDDQGGVDALNEAFSDPPVSTEQVMHLEKYLAGEAPVPVNVPNIIGVLGEGWSMVYDDVPGEAFLRIYLETAIPETMAASGAAGWGGGRLQMFEGPEGAQVLVMLTDWDSPEDAEEFFDVSVTPLPSGNGLPFASLQGDDVLVLMVSPPELLEEVRPLFAGY